MGWAGMGGIGIIELWCIFRAFLTWGRDDIMIA